MSEIPQATSKNEASAVEHHVMDILNPTLHHHDLLQSYVRTRAEASPDTKQDYEEFEEPSKKTHPNKYPTIADDDNYNGRDDSARRDHEKQKNNNNKKEKERFDVVTIESDMKIQKSRRKWRQKDNDGRRQEEVYTDKDRAAAVNMGSTDIKQSLRMKQRQDRSRSLQIPEETEPGALLALGLREMRFGDVNVAINCINKVHYFTSFYDILLIFYAISIIRESAKCVVFRALLRVRARLFAHRGASPFTSVDGVSG